MRRVATNVLVVLILNDLFLVGLDHGGPGGNAILVKGFYCKVISFSVVHGLEPVVICVIDHDAGVQFAWGGAIVDVIAGGVVYGFPFQPGAAFIFFGSQNYELPGGFRFGAGAFS